MLVHDAFRNGQPQARSLGIQAAGYERLEDLRQHVGRNAGPIVFDRDGDPGLRVAIQPPRIYRDAARGADGIQSIAEQVDEDLDQAVGIAGYHIALRHAEFRKFTCAAFSSIATRFQASSIKCRSGTGSR